MATTERIIEGLPEQTQKLLQAYSKDVKGVYDDQLEGLILYGSAVRGEFMPGRSNLNLLLVVAGYDAAMLKRYEPVHKRWGKEGIIIPLFLTEQEIRTSSALFPLEYLEIQEHHRVLGGRDPFVGFHVDVSRVADAVMQGLAGHVLRLRQRFAETGGANDAVMILLPLAVDRSAVARHPTNAGMAGAHTIRRGHQGRRRSFTDRPSRVARGLDAETRDHFAGAFGSPTRI
jgi:hypothetical protein